MVQTPSVVLTEIVILFSMTLLKAILPQTVPADPSGPSIAQCGSPLMPLTSCVQFVQGRARQPTQQCCDNLKLAYIQQRPCLCLFLNGTALASLPINTTLALELPALCSPQIDLSSCSFSGNSTDARSPPSPIPPERKPDTPAAAPPTTTLAPSPSTLRFRMEKNPGIMLRGEEHLGVSVAVITLLLAKLI